MSPGNDNDILPFSNGEEFVKWAGKKLAESILSGVASAVVGEIWDAIVGSEKTTEELLKDAVKLFAAKVEAILQERDLDIAAAEFRALMHGLDNLSIRIEEHSPDWWRDENLREELLDEIRNRENHAIALMDELVREKLAMAGWPTYMMVGSLLLRIYATRMSVPEYEETEKDIIAKDIVAFIDHHWDMCGVLRETLWSSFKSIRRGDLAREYSLRVPDLSLIFLFFRITSEYNDQLNQNIVPEGLRQAFELHGNSLHSDSTVRVMSESNEWLITDGVSNKRYIIRQQGNQINIYLLREEPPAYYDIIDARDLLLSPGGYWFEVNTPRVAERFETISGISMGELFDKIPPVEYAVRPRAVDDKILPGNSPIRIKPVGNNQYWIYGTTWAVYFIPEVADSEEIIRQTLVGRKYGFLLWLWLHHVRSFGIGSLHDVTMNWWAAQESDQVRPAAIRAPNGNYVVALSRENDRGQLLALRNAIREDTIFQVIKRQENIAFYAHNQNYVAAELSEELENLTNQGELVANRPWIRQWEEFRLTQLDYNKVALRATNNKYVSAPSLTEGGAIVLAPRLTATSEIITEDEKFEIIHLRDGAWHHNSLMQATGAPLAASGPTGYTWDVDETQHVVYRGADNHIHELWFHRDSGWQHSGLTQATGAPLAASGPAGYTWDVDETQHVVYRGADNHIHELRFHRDSGWQHSGLTQATGAPLAASGPAGYTWDVDETQHVVYRGADNHIHELWFHRDSGWQHSGLTQATGAPLAASGPAGYTWDVDETQHVVYRGADNHIHELWFHRDSGWHHSGLTQATGAPLAASGPAGYTWDVDETQHVVYRGADNHIHELWFHRDSGWQHSGLTQATGAPLAASGPAGYTWDVDETQHVVYRGADNHIHELWFHRDSGWQHSGLTQATGAPLAASGPAGYTWDVDETQHVVYQGYDNHLHELWFPRWEIA